MIYVSLALYAIYALDVAMGAFANQRFLTDVQECLVLMLGTLFFTIDILRRQYRYKHREDEASS